MDEKKVREAIIYLKVGIEINKETIASMSGRFPTKSLEKEILNKETAIEALEKQLPKKVDMQTEYKDLNGALVCHTGFCPSCGCAVEEYRNKSCNRCTQMLDWSKI